MLGLRQLEELERGAVLTLAAEEVCFARYSVWDHSCLVEGCQSLDLRVVENRIHN